MSPSSGVTAKIVSGGRELSHAELFERVARAASGFVNLGIGAGSAVALMLRNDFPFFEASLAASSIGAQAVPVNWHFYADEAGYILRDCGAKVLVVHSDLLPKIAKAIPASVQVFVVPTPPEIQMAYGIRAEDVTSPTDLADWDDWVSGQQALAGLGPPQVATSMIYTSGTTGKPKGVRRQPNTPASTATLAEMFSTVFGLGESGDFRTVVTGPMYHAAPNAYGLRAARTGGFCVLQPRFDAEGLLALIDQYRITHVHLVPTMFVRLLKLPDETRRKYDLSSLEFVVHGAAPCPPELKRQMIDWWGPVINEYYGGTETGAVVFHTSEEALRKPGTVGRPLPGAEVRVYAEDGNPLGPNKIGDVYARLHGFSDFTYHGMDDVRRTVERDGLIFIGDMGYLDEDGYLFLCDRKNYMVISGGANIYPAEIEAVLTGMPGVRDCAVFSIPDDEFGESLCAYIECDPGVALEPGSVRDFLNGRLARYKIPKLIEFCDELPREDSGKIFKRKLRAPYWENTGRRI
jgi:long-chain acyl-CoA synthetase